MPMLPKHRAFLPACLVLGTLLWALPILADAPTVPAGVGQAQAIVLQHVLPGDILKTMHWDQAAHLPAGVTQISSQPATNSLSVVATPAGFAEVRKLVKLLDIEPRQVQIESALANATTADLKASGISFESAPLPSLLTVPMPDTKYATGNGVALFLQRLTKQGAVTQFPVLTTSNNVGASLTLTTTARSQVASSVTFAATPRVNSDDSVTLALHPVFLDGTTKREIKTLRTIKSGDTMVVIMPPVTSAVGGKDLLLFVTPTIIGDTSPSAMPKK